MIVVDTSVWVAHFRNQQIPPVATFRSLPSHEVMAGDIILLECMQGARDHRHAGQIEATLRAFRIDQMLNTNLATEAARHYRTLRALGVTPRRTADLIIATFCIANGFALLHQDRDFDPMVQHLGLQVVI
jgi:hypothetical protein